MGQHSFNTVRTVNINAVDFGAAFLPQNQNPNLVSATPGGAALSTDLMRSFRGYGAINQRMFNGWRTFHSLQMSVNRRFSDGVSFGLNDTWVLYDHAGRHARSMPPTAPTRSAPIRRRPTSCSPRSSPTSTCIKGNFVWDLPDLKGHGRRLKALGLVINDWQLSGVWTASTGGIATNAGGAYNVTRATRAAAAT